MRNLLLIAQREFLVHVKKRSFLFAVFGMPILMGVIFAVVVIATIVAEESGLEADDAMIGYVDLAEIIVDTGETSEQFIAYENDAAARAALENGDVDVYFVLPPLYMANGTVRIVSNGNTSSSLKDAIELFIAGSLAQQIESDVPTERLLNPVEYDIFMENTGRELTTGGLIGLFIVPVIFFVVLMVGLQLTSTFLMSGVVEEKTNHIMEILITSVRPYELLAGKVLGLSLLGLLQIGVWIIIGVVIYLVAGDTGIFSGIALPLDLVVLAVIYFLLTYFMFSSLLAGIGAVVGGEQESRQYASVASILLVLPMFFFALFLTNPTSPIITALTLFPFTSALTIMLKTPFAPVPAWQIAVSLSLLVITTGLVVWASAKVFRWGILLQGKKVGPRTLMRVIGGQPDMGSVPVSTEKGVSA